MAGTDDGIVGQSQNFVQVVRDRVFVRNIATTHGAGKNGITDDGEWISQAGDKIGHAAARVPPRQQRLDFQFTNLEFGTFSNCLRARGRFPSGNENRCAGRFHQSWKIRNVIGVSVRQQN